MKQTLTNKDLIEKLCDAFPSIKEKHMKAIFEGTLDLILQEVISGNRVNLEGLFSLYMQQPKVRMLYNPADDEKQPSPAYPRLRMKTSPVLTEQIKKGLQVECFEIKE